MKRTELHAHDMFSCLDGYGTPEEMMERANEIGLKAFAITNHGNQYSWIYYAKLHEKYPDIKIIYGVEVYECQDMTVKDPTNKYFHLIVLAKNEPGRKALNTLVTKSNLEGFYYKPRLDINAIKPYAKDLIISSACLASKLARESDYQKCVNYVKEYKAAFPYFYLEIQSHNNEEQNAYNKKILQLSQDTDTPYVITTDAHAAKESDLFYQKWHVQIAHDNDTLNEAYEGCYLQSVEELHEHLDSVIGENAVDVGILESNNVADLIEDVKMPFQPPRLPTFPLPEGFNDNYEYLKYLVSEGWTKRRIKFNDDEQKKTYEDRANYELNIIHNMGFDGYFLIVRDFIIWAKNNGVAVGDGRGSCAGSLVCYLIGVTNVDPIQYGLIFERFLNPERVSMPDCDVDVSDRAKVINYLINKYGEYRVCQILNFSYITPTVAIQDVGKVLGFEYNEMHKLSSKFAFKTFKDCVDNNKTLLEENPKYTELFDIAGHLSGRVKTVSTHAGGVGIVDTSISDYMGMKLGEKGEHVIEVDKHDIENIGIIKFDILGVRTLSVEHEALHDIGIPEEQLDVRDKYFINDEKTYKLIDSMMTDGVFQLESAGAKDLLARVQPKTLNDISAVLALDRPDALQYADDFIAVMHGEKEADYIHPDMQPILKDTYGAMLFQEELMNIVRKFGGRTMGGADLFRKAIGKKDINLVKSESDKLYGEIVKNGYSEDIAKAITDDLREKGGYMFNASHSLCYAVLSYKTAWIKAHYPTEFFKALLNDNKNSIGNVNRYIIDAQQFNVEILSPNINKSECNFSIDNGRILFGLSAIAKIGEDFANNIIAERNEHGEFKGTKDFIERINPTKAQMISLIKAGAIPCKDRRKYLIKYLTSLYTPLEFKPVSKVPSYKSLIYDYDIDVEKYRIGDKKYDYDKDRMLVDFNQLKKRKFDEEQQMRYQKYLDENEKYITDEKFWEFEALQIFIHDNPFTKANEHMKRPFMDCEQGDECTLVGIIAKIQRKKDKNKKTFAYVNVYSSFGLVEVLVWHSQLSDYEDLISKGSQIAMYVKKEGDSKAILKEMKPYGEWLKGRDWVY